MVDLLVNMCQVVRILLKLDGYFMDTQTALGVPVDLELAHHKHLAQVDILSPQLFLMVVKTLVLHYRREVR